MTITATTETESSTKVSSTQKEKDMSEDKLVSEHETPRFSREKMKELRINALEGYFGSQLRVCGYCGGYKHYMYICSCGYDKAYADENGPNGELIEVWAKV